MRTQGTTTASSTPLAASAMRMLRSCVAAGEVDRSDGGEGAGGEGGDAAGGEAEGGGGEGEAECGGSEGEAEEGVGGAFGGGEWR